MPVIGFDFRYKRIFKVFPWIGYKFSTEMNVMKCTCGLLSIAIFFRLLFQWWMQAATVDGKRSSNSKEIISIMQFIIILFYFRFCHSTFSVVRLTSLIICIAPKTVITTSKSISTFNFLFLPLLWKQFIFRRCSHINQAYKRFHKTMHKRREEEK